MLSEPIHKGFCCPGLPTGFLSIGFGHIWSVCIISYGELGFGERELSPLQPKPQWVRCFATSLHIINKTLQVLVPDIPDETSAGFVLSLDRIVLYRSLQLFRKH